MCTAMSSRQGLYTRISFGLVEMSSLYEHSYFIIIFNVQYIMDKLDPP